MDNLSGFPHSTCYKLKAQIGILWTWQWYETIDDKNFKVNLINCPSWNHAYGTERLATLILCSNWMLWVRVHWKQIEKITSLLPESSVQSLEWYPRLNNRASTRVDADTISILPFPLYLECIQQPLHALVEIEMQFTFYSRNRFHSHYSQTSNREC